MHQPNQQRGRPFVKAMFMMVHFLNMTPLIAKNPLIEIVPAKSFGDVSLGEAKESIMKKGYALDTDRQGDYLVKEPLHVRIENNKAAEIWFENIHIPNKTLRYNGKPLPSKPTLKNLLAFFGDCDKPIKGTGGILYKCCKGGVQIATFYGSNQLSFSVLQPTP